MTVSGTIRLIDNNDNLVYELTYTNYTVRKNIIKQWKGLCKNIQDKKFTINIIPNINGTEEPTEKYIPIYKRKRKVKGNDVVIGSRWAKFY